MVDEQDDLVAVLIAENPIGLLMQILECFDFVGISKNDNVFKNPLMQEEVGRPEVKRTKHGCGPFSAPVIECIIELRCALCQSMCWPFGNV